MKKIKKAQIRPPFIRSEIRSFTGCEASLYGNIATGGVIRIISRKAISPLDSTFSTTEKSLEFSDNVRRKNIRMILSKKFIPSPYPSSTEKNTPAIVFKRAYGTISLLNNPLPACIDSHPRTESLY